VTHSLATELRSPVSRLSLVFVFRKWRGSKAAAYTYFRSWLQRASDICRDHRLRPKLSRIRTKLLKRLLCHGRMLSVQLSYRLYLLYADCNLRVKKVQYTKNAFSSAVKTSSNCWFRLLLKKATFWGKFRTTNPTMWTKHNFDCNYVLKSKTFGYAAGKIIFSVLSSLHFWFILAAGLNRFSESYADNLKFQRYNNKSWLIIMNGLTLQ